MKIYLWLIGLLWVGVLSAQKQEMEQLQLNMEKLVQLRLMLQQAKQGYQLLQNGYTAVRDAARGNYDLHKSYLDGLLQMHLLLSESQLTGFRYKRNTGTG